MQMTAREWIVERGSWLVVTAFTILPPYSPHEHSGRGGRGSCCAMLPSPPLRLSSFRPPLCWQGQLRCRMLIEDFFRKKAVMEACSPFKLKSSKLPKLFCSAFKDSLISSSFNRHFISRGASIGNVQAHSKSDEGLIQKEPSSSEKSIVVGCGATSIDYLASVARFPQPDEKIRSVDFKVQGGGNAGNCLTGVARLGLRTRILSKVADDAFGRLVIDELIADGVDTSFIEVSEIGTTSFTYVIVDRETSTRTCINSPGDPPLKPQELPDGALAGILDGAKILYLDGRIPDTALLLAEEAKRKSIPVLIDAERKREGLDKLLALADYVVCSSKFPQAWTEAPTLPEALVEMAFRLPTLQFVIVTLGADGCVMLEKTSDGSLELELLNADTEYELLLKKTGHVNTRKPSSFASKVGLFQERSGCGDNSKVFAGRFVVGTAELIPPSELVDTTGSGDAFISAVLYSICTGMRTEEMLCFGAVVAATNCRALGARAGLPYGHEAKLLPFLEPPAM